MTGSSRHPKIEIEYPTWVDSLAKWNEPYESSEDKMRLAIAVSRTNVDRGDVTRETTGISGTGTYVIEPRYQISTVLAGHIGRTELGVHYFVRQGYAAPYFRSQVTGSVDATADTGKNVLLVSDVNDFRLPMMHSVDLRISRPFRLINHAWRVDVDLFNVINRATVTALGYDARLASFDTTQQVVSPFAARIGVRFEFK